MYVLKTYNYFAFMHNIWLKKEITSRSSVYFLPVSLIEYENYPLSIIVVVLIFSFSKIVVYSLNQNNVSYVHMKDQLERLSRTMLLI